MTSESVWTIVFPNNELMPSVFVKNNLLSSLMHDRMSAMTSDELVNRSLVRVDLSRLASSVGSDEDLRMSYCESWTLPIFITLSSVASADLS